jgi:2-oxoglutarate dehydrogenase E2 component (dihydrolipoamide succinyltransferase)
MKVEIKVPSMGESITEATVSNIIKPSGSQVSMDDEILELETDKVNQVLFAPQSGVITLTVNADDKVTIGQVLGFVDTEGQAQSAAPEEKKEPESENKAPPKEKKEETPKEKEVPVEKNKAASKEEKSAEAPKKEIKPTSQVARQGKEALLEDLKTQKPTETKQSQKAESSNGRETRRKMSNIRKVIAGRMVEVKNTTAMLTTFNEVDMSQIMALREKYKEAFQEKHHVKLGFMSFFVKASVAALKEFPDINSYIDGDEIVHREYYDIGVAVGTDKGVIVPVVRNADQLSYSEVENTIEQYAKKARDGSITMDDLQGGSFTITNGGVYGSMLSTPIINQNQSAILGLHKISKRAVVVDDEIVIRPIMYLALSYDHRIVDGKEAVSFLVKIKNALEYPASFLLDL